ncbi:cytidine deaminase-like protein [Coniella lustricola]|uniref:Cytidine deaminase-like protein n=1 Tax=Coniella lustricola TaxID=2025994 RepID=A0A2T3AI68_9PEZI|nr:cytidine deaminase-like protein [Coniella lustricola]
MATTTTTTDPAALLKAILTTTEQRIIPLTREGVTSGSKLFGAAILHRSDLTPHTVATNNERLSPLLHGEINCIQQFFLNSQPAAAELEETETKAAAPRPSPRDCIFFATHEPCSLCLSGITWAGFNEFYYLFTYEDSRDLFAIPYDIDILQEVFRVPAASGVEESREALERRELYNRKNKFFTGRSLVELVEEVEGEEERERLKEEIERVKKEYNALSATYQEGKEKGVQTASMWK